MERGPAGAVRLVGLGHPASPELLEGTALDKEPFRGDPGRRGNKCPGECLAPQGLLPVGPVEEQAGRS